MSRARPTILDVVVAIKADDVPAIIVAFPAPRFYVSEDAMLEAIGTGGMFNVIDARAGDKVDFWLLTDGPFDRAPFARRKEVDVLGIRLWVSSPEDTILAKLRWSKQLDVTDLWARLTSEAEEM